MQNGWPPTSVVRRQDREARVSDKNFLLLSDASASQHWTALTLMPQSASCALKLASGAGSLPQNQDSTAGSSYGCEPADPESQPHQGSASQVLDLN